MCQVLPLTVDLRDHRTCEAFFRHNDKLSASNSSLWFLKDVKGSTGRHIRLLRPPDIRSFSLDAESWDARAKRAAICNNSVASLGVHDLMTIHGRKFDHRVFVLLASLRPLVVYIHHGHLRFSALNLSTASHSSARASPASAGGGQSGQDDIWGRWQSRGSGYQTGGRADAGRWGLDDEDLARHVTNPRFGMRHSGDASLVLRPAADLFAHVAGLSREALRRGDPVERAERELGDAGGWGRGSAVEVALQASLVNALLQVVFSIAHRFYFKGDKVS